MPPLPNRNNRHKPVLGSGGIRAVRTHTKKVSQRIDAPGGIEDESILNVRQSQGNEPILTPAEDGDQSGETEAEEHSEGEVVLLLEHNDLVLLQVLHVGSATSLNDQLVFLQKQPSAVREKQTILRVMGVLLGVGVTVVSAVVTRPMPDGTLVGTTVAKHQKDLDGGRGGVRAVRPQTVSSSGDTQTIKDMEGDTPDEGLVGRNGDSSEDTHEGPEVNESEVSDVEPVELGEEGLKLGAGGGEGAGSGGNPSVGGNEGGGVGFLGKSEEEDAEREVEGFHGEDVVVVHGAGGDGKSENEFQKDVTLFPVHKFAHHVVGGDKGADGFPQRREDNVGGTPGSANTGGEGSGRRRKNFEGAVNVVKRNGLEDLLGTGGEGREEGHDGVGVFLGKMTKVQTHNQGREKPELEEATEELLASLRVRGEKKETKKIAKKKKKKKKKKRKKRKKEGKKKKKKKRKEKENKRKENKPQSYRKGKP